jgi:twinfilin-like protein
MHAPCACQVLFVFCCPDDAPVRGKMLHASSKSSMLEGLQQAFGVVVEKSIEINEPADLTEAWLSAEVYGQAPSASGASATLTAKAAPRGGRRLIRKPKEPSAAEE